MGGKKSLLFIRGSTKGAPFFDPRFSLQPHKPFVPHTLLPGMIKIYQPLYQRIHLALEGGRGLGEAERVAKQN